MDLLWTNNFKGQTGYGKTTFVEGPLPVRFGDLWIHQRLRTLTYVIHEETLLNPNLGSSQTNTLGFIHHWHHVFDHADHAPIDVFDWERFLPKDWVA